MYIQKQRKQIPVNRNLFTHTYGTQSAVCDPSAMKYKQINLSNK